MSGFIKGLPQPAAPEGFGYLGDYRIQSQEMPDISYSTPEQVSSELARYNERPALPDSARLLKGTMDHEMMARAYAAASGQDSGLVGVTPELARNRLTELGLPLDPNAWSKDEYEAKLAELAAQPSVLALLGFE